MSREAARLRDMTILKPLWIPLIAALPRQVSRGPQHAPKLGMMGWSPSYSELMVICGPVRNSRGTPAFGGPE
jgi:hypothetical protein